MKGRIQWMCHFNELDYKRKEKTVIKAGQIMRDGLLNEIFQQFEVLTQISA